MGRRGDRPSLETKTTNKWSDNDASTTAREVMRVAGILKPDLDSAGIARPEDS
jgi:hypothetical protein